MSATDPAVAAPPTLPQIFLAFSKVGLTSFGGGLSGWMMREFVQQRRWLSESDFLSGLALAQSFPGVNVVNLAIWIGFRLRGGPGALLGGLGITVPPMLVAIAAAALFARLAQSHGLHVAMAGVAAAAAAVGVSLQTGLRAARRALQGWAPAAVMGVTFAAIFLLRLPLLWVVGVMAPLSIGIAYSRLRRRERQA
ncbi:chromate transporter [Achromobacter xylosoxidans]|uniref:Chromate transporter n=1 Tax=Alcaligenes xylosoxydans xylosoxydans TaxID=85698 RepID=A0A0X8P0P0_ALCXX|nr:chromate transporter [Achromobacter xylosoxidans]AMG37684.1 chromate transporter [Achromobacter xylosoxidans]